MLSVIGDQEATDEGVHELDMFTLFGVITIKVLAFELKIVAVDGIFGKFEEDLALNNHLRYESRFIYLLYLIRYLYPTIICERRTVKLFLLFFINVLRVVSLRLLLLFLPAILLLLLLSLFALFVILNLIV